MELDVNSIGEEQYLRKYLFNLKTHRSDGLILQVHHSYSDSCGENKRYRFIHASFNETGTCLAICDHKGNIFVIDLEMEKYWQVSNIGLVSFISFAASRKQEVLCGLESAEVVFLHTETGKVTGILNGHSVPITEVSFTDNGCYCLTSCFTEAIVWDLSTFTQIHRLSLKLDVSLKKVIFMPVTNNILACFQDDTMTVWQFGTFECIKQIIPETSKSHHLRAVAVTKNGRAMVVGGHTPNLVIFCLDTWSVKKVVEFPENITGVKQLEFVPQVFDGGANRVLAILTTSLDVYFFVVETSTFVTGMSQIFGKTAKLTVSPNGKYLASIFTTGEVSIYATEKILTSGGYSEISVSSSRNQRSSSNNRTSTRNASACSKKSSQSLSSIKKQLQELLDLKKLKPILRQFGEYPESYRVLIWKTILQLPDNQESFLSLSSKPCHPSYTNLESKYSLVNKSLCNSLKKLLSNLSYWCPLFGEVNFLPEFVFPFVKLFHSDPLGCFEFVATIIVNWCQTWFEFYPFPPINMLSALENILGHHDPDLLEFYLKKNITSSTTVCSLFHTAFSEVLSKAEWLKLWDHVISNEPSFLFMAIISYNVVCRNAIRSLKDADEIEKFFHNQNPIDMKKLISKAYLFLRETPGEIHCRQFFTEFRRLGSGGTYATFLSYPKLIVDPSIEKLTTIRREEEEILEEQMKTLSMREKMEKRFKGRDGSAENRKRMCRELEDKIKQIVDEEEERVLNRRKNLQALKQELRMKEIEMLEKAREKTLREKQERKELELERLLRDISKRRAREKTEVDIVENEMRKYYSELLLKKCQLEADLGASEDETEPRTGLEQQWDKLRGDIRKLQSEWSSLNEDKQTEVLKKVASIRKLFNDLETEITKEVAKRQCDGSHNGIERLKEKVNTLECHIKSLLEENLTRMQVKRQEDGSTCPKPVDKPRERDNLVHRKLKPILQSKQAGIKKSGTEKVKRIVRTKKVVTTAKPRSSQVSQAKKSKTAVEKVLRGEAEDAGVGKTKREQKQRSKFTCKTERLESDVTDSGEREKCVCGESKADCKYARNKKAVPAKEYSTDSDNEIFKVALRTRKQLIDEAKRRQV